MGSLSKVSLEVHGKIQVSFPEQAGDQIVYGKLDHKMEVVYSRLDSGLREAPSCLLFHFTETRVV